MFKAQLESGLAKKTLKPFRKLGEKNVKKLLLSAIGLGVITLTMTEPANAAGEDTAYVFNTLLFLIGGFLVMWMAAGFAMLEAGMVRSKKCCHAMYKKI